MKTVASTKVVRIFQLRKVSNQHSVHLKFTHTVTCQLYSITMGKNFLNVSSHPPTSTKKNTILPGSPEHVLPNMHRDLLFSLWTNGTWFSCNVNKENPLLIWCFHIHHSETLRRHVRWNDSRFTDHEIEFLSHLMHWTRYPLCNWSGKDKKRREGKASSGQG